MRPLSRTRPLMITKWGFRDTHEVKQTHQEETRSTYNFQKDLVRHAERCVQTQENSTVKEMLVFKDCLRIYVHLTTQHIGANKESAPNGAVTKMVKMWNPERIPWAGSKSTSDE